MNAFPYVFHGVMDRGARVFHDVFFLYHGLHHSHVKGYLSYDCDVVVTTIPFDSAGLFFIDIIFIDADCRNHAEVLDKGYQTLEVVGTGNGWFCNDEDKIHTGEGILPDTQSPAVHR